MKLFEIFGLISLKGGKQAEDRLKKFDEKARKAGEGLRSLGLAMSGFGAAVVAPLGLATKAAIDFNSAMSEVNTLMNLSEDEFADLNKDILELSSSLGVDAVESANALYQAISAGIPKENALEFLDIASKAAIAGVTDTKTAVDGLSTVINAFKLPLEDTEQVADIMFQTVKNGKTTFEELSAAMSTAAPIAASLGVDFKQVAAATATLTKSGVPTGEAMTQIRAAMVALAKPTEDMQRLLSNLGYESGEALLQTEGFQGAMLKLRDAANGNNEVLAKAFGRVQGLNAMLGVTGINAEAAAKDLADMGNSTGAAADAFAIMEESVGRQLKKVGIQIKNMGIEIGSVLLPILSDLLMKVSEVAKSIFAWMKENDQLVKGLTIAAGALGSLAVGIGAPLAAFGQLLIMLPKIMAGIKLVGTTITSTNPILYAAAAAVAALVVVIEKLNGRLDETHARLNETKRLQDEVKTGMMGGIETWKQYGEESVESLRQQGLTIDQAKAAAQGLFTAEANMIAAGNQAAAEKWRVRAELYKQYYMQYQTDADLQNQTNLQKDQTAAQNELTVQQQLRDQLGTIEEEKARAAADSAAKQIAASEEIAEAEKKKNGEINESGANSVIERSAQIDSLVGATEDLLAGNLKAALSSLILSALTGLPYPANLIAAAGAKVALSKIPGLAEGGIVQRPGEFMVGEEGIEKVRLPRGTEVTPLDKANGGGVKTIVQNFNFAELSPETAPSIFTKLTQAARNGITEARDFSLQISNMSTKFADEV